MAACRHIQRWWLCSEQCGYLPVPRNDACGSLNKSSSPSIIRSAILLVISEVPFLLFLAAYGANEFLRILPTINDPVQNHTLLHDVVDWERLALSPLMKQPFAKPLNHIVSSVHCTALDILAAVPYLAHYTLPVVCPFVLVALRREDCARRFNVLLGTTMWVFYVIWYFLPTAPPWYQESFAATDEVYNGDYDSQTAVSSSIVSGGVSSTTVQSLASLTASRPPTPMIREGAAFARLDRLFDVAFFRSIFAGNLVPFGAFPSGHVAWPTCFVISVPGTSVGWYRRLIIGGGYVSLVAWATLYSSHHYAADVIAAVFIVIIINWLLDCLHIVKDTTSVAGIQSSVAVETCHCHSDAGVLAIHDVFVDDV